MTWRKGQSGNPYGRSSTHHRLYQSFYRGVFQKWLKHGDRCLDEMIRKQPAEFVRLVAGMMPKNLVVQEDQPLDREALIDQVVSLLHRVEPRIEEEHKKRIEAQGELVQLPSRRNIT